VSRCLDFPITRCPRYLRGDSMVSSTGDEGRQSMKKIIVAVIAIFVCVPCASIAQDRPSQDPPGPVGDARYEARLYADGDAGANSLPVGAYGGRWAECGRPEVPEMRRSGPLWVPGK